MFLSAYFYHNIPDKLFFLIGENFEFHILIQMIENEQRLVLFSGQESGGEVLRNIKDDMDEFGQLELGDDR
jgi:hypothetical protein